MAIVHMNKRVDKFINQLDLHDEKLFPDPQLFDYRSNQEVWRFDEEITISLRDFHIYFFLIIEQKGTYTPADHCQPEEFNEDSTSIEINDFQVYDDVYGEYLRFNREEFTEIVNKVKDLIEI